MTSYYYVRMYEVFGRSSKVIQEFKPAKSFAQRIGNPHFGGFVIKERDDRSFENLKREDWVTGLEILEGGHGVIIVRGSDLYRTEKEIQEKLEQLPSAVTKQYDTNQVQTSLYDSCGLTIGYDESTKKGKQSNCCIII